MKFNLKTPVTYYGGKQKLVPEILKRIPSHERYVEPFCGGAAVFFAKQPADIEVLNDTNKELVNFYRVVQNRLPDLQVLVRATLHSRDAHSDAITINNNPHLFDEIRRAWALWVLSSQSFCAMLDGSWGYDKQENRTTFTIQKGAVY
jgi:DNA adenine methylase